MQTRMESIDGERGAALILTLLLLAMLLAMTMGITLTAVSEQGVTATYQRQSIAFHTAEAGLNHAASLVANYTGDDFTSLLGIRGSNYAFPINSANFAPGTEMIVANDDSGNPILTGGNPTPANATNGHALRDGVTGAVVPGAFYYVTLIDDEPSGTATPSVPDFSPGASYVETVGSPAGTNAHNPNVDLNNRIVIYSTGTYQTTSVQLEGWIAFLPYPAFSANKDIEISGSSLIQGLYGSVHSNQDLIPNGGAWYVTQSATATGSILGSTTGHVGGFSGGGQAAINLPKFVTKDPLTSGGPATSPRIQDFIIQRADRILIDPNFANGADPSFPNANAASMRLGGLADRLNVPYTSLVSAVRSNPGGASVAQTQEVAISITRAADGSGTASQVGVGSNVSNAGWKYQGGNWDLTNNSNSDNHTFYVVGQDNYNLSNPALSTPNGGNVQVTGNSGSPGSPLHVTILATGSIEMRGNPNIVANLRNVLTPFLPPFVQVDFLLVAAEDVWLNGDTDGAQTFVGICYAGEQVNLSGNGSIQGQMIAYSNTNVAGSPVQGPTGDRDRSTITGNFTLTLNNGNSVGTIKLYSWRQIKN